MSEQSYLHIDSKVLSKLSVFTSKFEIAFRRCIVSRTIILPATFTVDDVQTRTGPTISIDPRGGFSMKRSRPEAGHMGPPADSVEKIVWLIGLSEEDNLVSGRLQP